MPHTTRVTYCDTAMTLIEIGSLRLLTDPVLDPAAGGGCCPRRGAW